MAGASAAGAGASAAGASAAASENPFIVAGDLVFLSDEGDVSDVEIPPNQGNFEVLLAQVSALVDKTPGDRVINAAIQALHAQLNPGDKPWDDLSVKDQIAFLATLQEHLDDLLADDRLGHRFGLQVGRVIQSDVEAGQAVAFDVSGAKVRIRTLRAVVRDEISMRERICGVSKPCCNLTLRVAVGLLAAAGIGVAIWRIVSGFQKESAGADAAIDAGEGAAQFGPGVVSAAVAIAYACRRAAVVSGQHTASALAANTDGVRATQDRRGRLKCGLAIAGVAVAAAAVGVVVCELFDKRTEPGTAAHTGFSSGAAVSLMLGLVALPWALAASGLLCASSNPHLPPRRLDLGGVEMGGGRAADLRESLLGAAEEGQGIDGRAVVGGSTAAVTRALGVGGGSSGQGAATSAFARVLGVEGSSNGQGAAAASEDGSAVP